MNFSDKYFEYGFNKNFVWRISVQSINTKTETSSNNTDAEVIKKWYEIINVDEIAILQQVRSETNPVNVI